MTVVFHGNYLTYKLQTFDKFECRKKFLKNRSVSESVNKSIQLKYFLLFYGEIKSFENIFEKQN